MNHPERFGKYVVSGILGRGAMGAVYKAFDPDIQRVVAIKTIRVDLSEGGIGSDALAARFRTEAQAAGRLSHPGIVAVYEFGRDQDCAFIAMEYVEGSTLRDYFASKTVFGQDDVVSIVVQLLEALGHAHERKVWHRDVKPANLIVMADGRVKVADFGIARIETSDLTQTSMMMGTPGYIPPEMYMGGKVDQRADLFASAAVLYQLIAGRPAFHGSADEVMYGVVNLNPPPIASLPGLARWAHFDPVLTRALAKSPDRRFQSAAEFRDAVLQAHERTVVVAPAAVAVADTVVAAPPVQQSTVPGTLPGGWDAQTLAPLESHLAKVVGPLARVLVRRACQSCGDMDQLVDTLASELGSSEERSAFLNAVRSPPPRGKAAATDGGFANTRGGFANTRGGFANTSGGFANTRGAPTGPTSSGFVDSRIGPLPASLSPQDVDLALQVLGTQIGPLARVIVKNAAKGAASLAQFHQRIAEGIPGDADRDAFLRQVGARR
jgi:hypothetical protein